MSQPLEQGADSLPLCVDLDGTLINTDSLVESALLLIKRNPLCVFSLLLWLCRGKANLKEQLARRSMPDVVALPYNQAVLGWLQTQQQSGRRLVLVSAANFRVAQAVAAHLDLFDEVIASDATRNNAAEAKRERLVARFGDGGFDYAGNSAADLVVWSACRRAVLVNVAAAVAGRAAATADVEMTFPRNAKPLLELFRAMRPHQWSKNTLIFVSIITSHTYGDTALLLSTSIGFLSYCLCASSAYLVNDLLDLGADRIHSEKRYRPFAAGTVPVIWGVAAAPCLLLAALALAVYIGPMFVAVLCFSFGTMLTYSLLLKRLVLIDVLTLAWLYTLRIIAGDTVAESVPSVWLVSFSIFIFTSLAMVKRYAELQSLREQEAEWAEGRGYHVADLQIIAHLGAASGLISILVLALYIDSFDVAELYTRPLMMWLLCPLLMYWIGRIWLLAGRGQLRQDPVIFATRDWNSYAVLLLGAFTVWLAR